MTFAVPLFLIAAVAGAIPVVLHLISRQKAKDLPFPTLRFLRISAEKTRRRKRIQDLLLMLLRVAVLLLIAMGLARPTVTNLAAFWGSEANTAVAIILDNSASMGTIDGDRVRFDVAVSAAGQILDQLEEDDQVALFLTGGPRFEELGRLQRTQEKVLQILQQAKVSYEGANLATLVQAAGRQLADSQAANKYIYVITDMRASCWEGLDEAKQSAGETPLIVVDCNRKPKPNMAIQDVAVRAPLPVTGVDVTARVELLNASQIDQQRHVELYLDGVKQQDSPMLGIPAGGRQEYTFTFQFDRGGLRRGEVRLAGDDGSKFDDRRFFTMQVDQAIPVALVRSRQHEIPYLDDVFYLEQALTPRPTGDWAVRPVVLTTRDLATEMLESYPVIFCVNLPAPDAQTAARLRDYVTAGGNLVWLAGDNVDAEAYNRMNGQTDDELLPAPLAGVREPRIEEGRDSWSVGFLDKGHPALTDLVEPPSLYESILVYKHMAVEDDGTARVLARLDDGQPLLLSRDVGRGKVLWLGLSGHTDWSNLPLRPIFVPLLARLACELAGAEPTGRSVLAGQPLTLPLEGSAAATVEIQRPGGETVRKPATDGEDRPLAEFTYADTHDIGVYVLRLLDAARGDQTAWSVNADPGEAEPEKITREQLEERLAPTPVVFAEDPEDLASTFAWLREGKGLWTFFLVGVLIALVSESYLANRLTPRKPS